MTSQHCSCCVEGVAQRSWHTQCINTCVHNNMHTFMHTYIHTLSTWQSCAKKESLSSFLSVIHGGASLCTTTCMYPKICSKVSSVFMLYSQLSSELLFQNICVRRQEMSRSMASCPDKKSTEAHLSVLPNAYMDRNSQKSAQQSFCTVRSVTSCFVRIDARIGDNITSSTPCHLLSTGMRPDALFFASLRTDQNLAWEKQTPGKKIKNSLRDPWECDVVHYHLRSCILFSYYSISIYVYIYIYIYIYICRKREIQLYALMM